MTRRPRASTRDQGGFTLIEVLIALMILTIALVAIAGMFPTGYKQVVDAGRMTMAVTVGRLIMEDLRSVPFASLDNFPGNAYDSQSPPTLSDPNLVAIAARWQADFPSAEGRATIQVCGSGGNPCVPALPSANLRQVTVTVSLTALQQTIRLSTLFAAM